MSIGRSRSIGFALVVLVVVMVAGAVIGIRRSKQDKANRLWSDYRAELIADGEPVTFADLENLRPEIPDEKNGALVIEKLIPQLEKCGNEREELVPLFNHKLRRVDLFYGVPRYAVDPIKVFIDERKDLVESLVVLSEGLEGRVKGMSYDFAGDNPMDFTLAVGLGRWRDAAKLEQLKAISCILNRDLKGAIKTVPVQIGIFRTLCYEPNTMAHIMRLSIVGGVCDTVELIIRSGDISEEQCELLTRLLDIEKLDISLANALRCERVWLKLLFDGLASGKIDVKSVLSESYIEYIGIPTLLEIREGQVELTGVFSAVINAADDPRELVDAVRRIQDKYGVMRSSLVSQFVHSAESMPLDTVETIAEFRCVRTGLAAEGYRLSNGHFPKTLDVLVPEYIEKIPQDPFDGKPLKMAVTDYGILIYSIGEDGVDDGGDLKKREYSSRDVGFRLMEAEERKKFIVNVDPPRR